MKNEIITINFKSTIFKALADPSRLRILNFLRTGEKCACDIVPTIGFAQPTVSRHLKVLTDCGILIRRKKGNKMLYSVTSKKIFDLIDIIDSRFIESLSRNIVTNIQGGFR
ncbi:ArsR/SmtB family transcription factor [[Eubacterium] cellulosolvens]